MLTSSEHVVNPIIAGLTINYLNLLYNPAISKFNHPVYNS